MGLLIALEVVDFIYDELVRSRVTRGRLDPVKYCLTLMNITLSDVAMR
jgi:hypothetical protein